MRCWLAIVLLVGVGVGVAVPALAATPAFPPLSGRVVDQAHVLSPQIVQELTQTLAAEEQKTGTQLVVATVASLQGVPIEDFGYQLGRAWGIGQKDKNTGVILLVAPTEHKLRIEVGYGLEGTLTDAQSKMIIEEVIVPKFKAGQLPEGIVAGTNAILQVLDPDLKSADQPHKPADQSQTVQTTSIGLLPVMGIVFLVLWLLIRLSRRGGGSILPWLILPGLFGGRGRGGSDDDDSFSGGGGSFGGGGSSGSW